MKIKRLQKVFIYITLTAFAGFVTISAVMVYRGQGEVEAAKVSKKSDLSQMRGVKYNINFTEKSMDKSRGIEIQAKSAAKRKQTSFGGMSVGKSRELTLTSPRARVWGAKESLIISGERGLYTPGRGLAQIEGELTIALGDLTIVTPRIRFDKEGRVEFTAAFDVFKGQKKIASGKGFKGQIDNLIPALSR